MTAFDDMQQLWHQQTVQVAAPPHSTVIEAAQKKTAQLKARHRGTIVLLSSTVAGLVWYCAAWSPGLFSRFSLGLLLMAGSLILRVLLELISYRRFRRIDVQDSLRTYTLQMTLFYNRRRKIHYFFTPLVLLVYIAGFVILLPVFRQVFSAGFYLYILCSGIGFLSFITWLIARQAKQEMQVLAFLKALAPGDAAQG